MQHAGFALLWPFCFVVGLLRYMYTSDAMRRPPVSQLHKMDQEGKLEVT